jgi:hypothetical protein
MLEFKESQSARVIISRSIEMLSLSIPSFLKREHVVELIRGSFIDILDFNLAPGRISPRHRGNGQG